MKISPKGVKAWRSGASFVGKGSYVIKHLMFVYTLYRMLRATTGIVKIK